MHEAGMFQECHTTPAKLQLQDMHIVGMAPETGTCLLHSMQAQSKVSKCGSSPTAIGMHMVCVWSCQSTSDYACKAHLLKGVFWDRV